MRGNWIRLVTAAASVAALAGAVGLPATLVVGRVVALGWSGRVRLRERPGRRRRRCRVAALRAAGGLDRGLGRDELARRGGGRRRR